MRFPYLRANYSVKTSLINTIFIVNRFGTMNDSLLDVGEDISPSITKEEVQTLIPKLYGVTPTKISALVGYDDKNFRIFSNENVVSEEYVFKIMNKLDSQKISVVEAQNDIMLFLSRNGINCPCPVKNKSGKYYSMEKLKSGNHVVRMLTFLPGKIFHEMKMTDKNFFEAGEYIAKLDLILEDFHHPAYENHKFLWTLESVPELKKFTYVVTTPENKIIVNEVLEEFENTVLKNKHKLKHSIIHGDFNEQNIVVKTNEDGSWAIHGILDFGDCQHSATVFELAITLTYMILQGKSLDVAGHVLAGYTSIRKILEEEYQILKICIAARLCQSLILGAYSHLQHPENTYVLCTQENGWKFLKEIWREPTESLYKRWRAITASYN